MLKQISLQVKSMVSVALASTLLAMNVGAADAVESAVPLLEKPALPLMGIVKLDVSRSYPELDLALRDEDLSTILQMYEGLHVLGASEIKASKAMWETLTTHRPDFMILPYFQSTLPHAKLGISEREVEKDPLNMASMYLEGKLAEDLDGEATRFSFVLEDSRRGFGLKASTEAGDYSKSISQYISFVRIGDEIMKVLEVNPGSAEVTVQRGYKNTTAAAHKTGTPVFAPVYRGKRSVGSNPYGTSSRYPDKSDGGDQSVPQYHLRLDSMKAMRLVAEEGAEYIRQGATGLWLDLTSSGIFIPCNAHGDKVNPWNFERNKPYTPQTYAQHQDSKCHVLRELIREKTGITPVLVANNHGNGKYFRGGMDLVRSTDRKPEPIRGVTLEAAFCFYQSRIWFSIEQWTSNLSALIHGAQNDAPVWPWIKSVKYANLPMPDNAEADRFQFFDYASALLGYEKDAGMVCPLPLFRVNQQQERRFNLPDYLFYDLGEPIERVAYDETVKMKIPGKNTYRRQWSRALVFVNPTATDDADIAVPEGFIDPETNKPVRQLSMPAHSAKILLRAAEI